MFGRTLQVVCVLWCQHIVCGLLVALHKTCCFGLNHSHPLCGSEHPCPLLTSHHYIVTEVSLKFPTVKNIFSFQQGWRREGWRDVCATNWNEVETWLPIPVLLKQLLYLVQPILCPATIDCLPMLLSFLIFLLILSLLIPVAALPIQTAGREPLIVLLHIWRGTLTTFLLMLIFWVLFKTFKQIWKYHNLWYCKHGCSFYQRILSNTIHWSGGFTLVFHYLFIVPCVPLPWASHVTCFAAVLLVFLAPLFFSFLLGFTCCPPPLPLIRLSLLSWWCAHFLSFCTVYGVKNRQNLHFSMLKHIPKDSSLSVKYASMHPVSLLVVFICCTHLSSSCCPAPLVALQLHANSFSLPQLLGYLLCFNFLHTLHHVPYM